MLLPALYWYFQPSLLPILIFLAAELIVKLIIIQSQINQISLWKPIPEQLRSNESEKSKLYSSILCKHERFFLLIEQSWKAIQIILGGALFEFVFTAYAAEFLALSRFLHIHFLTIAVFHIAVCLTLIKRFVFLWEPFARTFCIDDKFKLNLQTGDDFFENFFAHLGISMLKNALMLSGFCEVSCLLYDITGLSMPSMVLSHWLIWAGAFYFLEKLPNSETPYEELIPISQSKYSLPNFIKMLAKSVGFPEENIFISGSSTRTLKQHISIRGLISPKIVIGDTLLAHHEQVFNPPLITLQMKHPGSEMLETNENENENIPQNVIMPKNDGSELLALVATQLGRWKNNDLWANDFVDKIFTFFGFGLTSILMMESETMILADLFGMRSETIASFFVSMLLFLGWVKEYTKNSVKRSQELAADKYAVEMGYSEDLKSALTTMYETNLELPLMGRIYEENSPCNSLLTRLETIDQEALSCVDADKKKLCIFAVKN